MIGKLGQLIDYITIAARQHNVSPFSRVIVREGAGGVERVIDHVVVRTTLRGPEVIIQVSEHPIQ
jgi:hypothetical protein